MAEPALLYAKEPTVPIQLFPEAMATGTNVGNAQKNTAQAIAEGITSGINAYQTTEFNTARIEGQELQNQRTQQQIELEPAKMKAEIEAAQAAAEHNRAVADLAKSKAEEQRQEDDLINSVSQGLASQDPKAINDLLGQDALYKLILKDPKKFSGLADAIQSVPGVDQNKVGFLQDYIDSQKTRQLYEAKAAALAGQTAAAEADLESNYLVGQLTDEAQNVTGNAYTRGEVTSKLVTAPAGEKVVKNGKLIPIPETEKELNPENAGKIDAFLREKDANGNDVFYPLQRTIDPKELKDGLKWKGLFAVTTGEELRLKLRDIARRRQGTNASLGAAGQAVTGPYQYGPPAKSAASALKQTQPPSDEIKSTLNELAITGNYSAIYDSIENEPSFKNQVKKEYKLNDTRVAEAAPAISILYKEAAERAANPPNWADRLGTAIIGRSVTEEEQNAKKDLAKAIAKSDYDTLKAASETNPTARNLLKSYDEDALKKYQQERAKIQAMNDDFFAQTSGVISKFDILTDSPAGLYYKQLAKLNAQYSEDPQTVEDLYYAKKKSIYDAQAERHAQRIQDEVSKKSTYEERFNSVNTQSVEELKSKAGDNTGPIIEPITSLNPFNASTAQAEELPQEELNSVQKGVQIGQESGQRISDAELEKRAKIYGKYYKMTKEEAQDYTVETAKKYGIPPEVAIGLITQESQWKEKAQSNKGAIGYTQLMPPTANMLGVDPNDPRQNIEGGMRYLAQLYKQFGSWDLAINAYNAGPGNVKKYKGKVPFRETQEHLKGVKKAAQAFLESKKTYA